MPAHIEEFIPDEGKRVGVAVDCDGGSFVITRAEDPSVEITRTPDPCHAAQTVAWALLDYARDATEGDWTDFSDLGKDILVHLDDYAALLESHRDGIPHRRQPR